MPRGIIGYLVHRIGKLYGLCHEGMTRFVKGNDFLLLGLMTRFFFSSPPITRSIASSNSFGPTACLSLRAARRAASLTRLARSAPTNPGVSGRDLAEVHVRPQEDAP